MHKVLFVIPSLSYSGAARQLMLLAAALPPEIERRVCVLGAPAPWATTLAEQGVPVECLGWDRFLNVRPLLRLREMVRAFRPDVIHAWRLPALRALAMTASLGQGRLVVSAPLPPQRQAALGWLDRWLLGKVDVIAVSGATEADRCRHLGLDRIVPISPAAVLEPAPINAHATVCRSLGLPETTRLMACVGPLEPHKGFREAVWAVDVLRHVYPEVHLIVIGSGSVRPQLDEFARIAQVTDRIHYLDEAASPTGLLAAAEVVWVPSHLMGGVNATLEAMAAARPVVAAQLPGLAELVVEGVTGFLVPPGDPVTLCRRTRRLLDQPDERRRMGEAGRQRVVETFAVPQVVQCHLQLYTPAPRAA